MKEYEVFAEIMNACAGSSHPETTIEEVELDTGSVTYRYSFTEI